MLPGRLIMLGLGPLFSTAVAGQRPHFSSVSRSGSSSSSSSYSSTGSVHSNAKEPHTYEEAQTALEREQTELLKALQNAGRIIVGRTVHGFEGLGVMEAQVKTTAQEYFDKLWTPSPKGKYAAVWMYDRKAGKAFSPEQSCYCCFYKEVANLKEKRGRQALEIAAKMIAKLAAINTGFLGRERRSLSKRGALAESSPGGISLHEQLAACPLSHKRSEDLRVRHCEHDICDKGPRPAAAP